MLSATWLWLSCTRGYARFAGIAALAHTLCVMTSLPSNLVAHFM